MKKIFRIKSKKNLKPEQQTNQEQQQKQKEKENEKTNNKKKEKKKVEIKRVNIPIDTSKYEQIFKKHYIGGERHVFSEGDVYFNDASRWNYGIMVITNFRLFFFKIDIDPIERAKKTDFIILCSAPRCTMYKIEKVGGRTIEKRYFHGYGYQLSIGMKDIRVLTFSLNSEHRTRGKIFNLLTSPMPPKFSFAFKFRFNDGQRPLPKKKIFSIEKEFGLRLQVIVLGNNKFKSLARESPHMLSKVESKGILDKRMFDDDETFRNWRISRINKEWEFCPTYPNYFCVPYTSSDEDLISCSNDRSKKRIPILCWANKHNGVCMIRSAQPTQGLNIRGYEFLDDQNFVDHVINTTKFKQKIVIVDLRPFINAVGNRFRGGGYERGYDKCEIHYLGIQNIHKVREGFKELFHLCVNTSGDDVGFIAQLNNTNWYYHVKQCLKAPLFCVKQIEKEHRSVLVHCSDGWDRTSQCACLTQLMIDPFFRTMEGFAVLIEKEWLRAGHMFQKRIGTGYRDFLTCSDRSPIFLQYFEAVRLLMEQHPTSFEFHDGFLILLMDEIYSARFGNFLFDSQKERIKNSIYQNTEDIWNYIFREDIKKQFINPFYDPLGTRKTIIPDLRFSSITLWTKYWLRYNLPTDEKQLPKGVIKNPLSPFLYFNSFKRPEEVLREKCFEMIKEIAKICEENNLTESRGEKVLGMYKNELERVNEALKREMKLSEVKNLEIENLQKELRALKSKKDNHPNKNAIKK